EEDRRGSGVHAAGDDRRSGDPDRDHGVAQNPRLSAEVPMTYPLPSSTPAQLGLDPAALERLMELVTRHVAERRYPGAQLAIARHGKLALARTLGDARLDPKRVAARDDTLWLLYSNTKVLTACAVWLLAERGALSFTDTVAAHVPGFEANGKGEITVIQLLTHQAGFPSAAATTSSAGCRTRKPSAPPTCTSPGPTGGRPGARRKTTRRSAARARRAAAPTRRRAGWRPSTRCCSAAARSAAAGCSRRG